MSDRTRKMLQDMIENFTAMGIFDAEIAIEGQGEGRVTAKPAIGDTVPLGEYAIKADVYGIVGPTPTFVMQPYATVQSWDDDIVRVLRNVGIPTDFVPQPVEQILPRGVKSKVINIKNEGTVQL